MFLKGERNITLIFSNLLLCCTFIQNFLNKAKVLSVRTHKKHKNLIPRCFTSVNSFANEYCISIQNFLNRAKVVLMINSISTHPSFSGDRYAEFFIYKKN